MQSINRDNYEDWMMLYLDNELTATERLGFEAFAAANPDVQEELEGLKETILQPEKPVMMPGFERLLMPEIWNEQALNRQQEQLLMMADGVLPETEKVPFEAEIANNPLLQKEWLLLQKTVLTPEMPAVMPNKEILYRYNEPLRIIPFGRILKFAAAAAILGFGWFFVNRLQPSGIENVPKKELVVETQGSKSTITSPPKSDSLIKVSGKTGQMKPAQYAAKEKSINENKQLNTNLIKATDRNNKENDAHNDALATTDNDAFSTTAENNKAMALKLTETTIIEVNGVEGEGKTISAPVSIADYAITTPELNVIPASTYEVVNQDEFEENETISIGGARINKQKIRNVYRNITRPIARTIERGGLSRAVAKK